jgi:hypothetical protein
MELHEYLRLDLNSRADLLWKEGILVDKFMDDSSTINLYHFHDFYVEVVLCNRDCKITEITPFKRGVRLEKYLSRIELKNLI